MFTTHKNSYFWFLKKKNGKSSFPGLAFPQGKKKPELNNSGILYVGQCSFQVITVSPGALPHSCYLPCRASKCSWQSDMPASYLL